MQELQKANHSVALPVIEGSAVHAYDDFNQLIGIRFDLRVSIDAP
jgi:hypothetical protein